MKLGFASIEEAASHAQRALRRFPLALLSGITAAVVAIIMVNAGEEDPDRVRLLATATLGLPLFVALETLRERRAWPTVRRAALLGGGVVVLVMFAILSRGWSPAVLAFRYVQFSLALHLLAAFLPFTGLEAKHAFWQYNRILFLRFLLSSLYTAVLYAGLAIALVALDNLFGIEVEPEAYVDLLVFLAFVFQPWFFLGGVPGDLGVLEQRTDYPTGLKIFAQFVLIPVVTVYVLILSAYLVRVLATRTWPSGWIGWLVSSVAAVGTLALLLVHPIREREDSRWVDAYARWFYVLLLPSIGMLLAAIYQRLAQYGFTEPRYFLLVLAFWLAAIALYYGLTGSRNIRIIPVTLCIVAIATIAGPWSAYAVSRNSQAGRLEGLLTAQGILSDGRIDSAAAVGAAPEVSREVSATVWYLVLTHGPQSLAKVSPELQQGAVPDTDGATGRQLAVEVSRNVVEHVIGLDYSPGMNPAPGDWVNFYASPVGQPIRVGEFEVLVRLELPRPDTTLVPFDTDTLSVRYTASPAGLEIRGPGVLADIPIWPLVDRLRSEPGPRRSSGPPLELTGENGGARYRLLIHNLNGHGRGEAVELTSVSADLLLSFEPPGGS